ncbi:hypothetical protein Tco_0003332 [Tanacetum coccineum]
MCTSMRIRLTQLIIYGLKNDVGFLVYICYDHDKILKDIKKEQQQGFIGLNMSTDSRDKNVSVTECEGQSSIVKDVDCCCQLYVYTAKGTLVTLKASLKAMGGRRMQISDGLVTVL